MSDAAVDAAYERSEQLRRQWDALKADMLAIDPSQPNAAERRDHLRAQMDQVMNQLSSVLDDTRRLLPAPNTVADDDPIIEARPVQYSANRKHVIYRTYESSDSSQSSQSDELSVPEQPPKPPLRPPALPIPPPSPPMSPTVDMSVLLSPESNRHSVAPKRSSLSTFTKGIRGKLRLNDSNSSSPRVASPAAPTVPAPVAKESRDQLLREQTRLERESRRLNRKPYRCAEDDKRLLDIASALSRISSTLAEDVISAQAPGDKLSDGASSSSRSRRCESEADKDVPFSPVTDDSVGRAFDSNADSLPPRARAAKSSHPKRKKGWSALEAGFASFKALGRSVKHAAASSASRADGRHELNSTRAKDKDKARPVGASRDVFSEAVDRVHERGEKLDGVAHESERMAGDANDMLSAARALNQRHKGGFFS